MSARCRSPAHRRGLVAADALADLDDHVFAVRGVGLDERELQLFLERHEPFLELGDELPQVAVGACVIEIGACLPPALPEAMRALELLQLSPGVGRFTAVVVDGRVGHALLRFLVRAVELVEQWFDVAGHRRSTLAL